MAAAEQRPPVTPEQLKLGLMLPTWTTNDVRWTEILEIGSLAAEVGFDALYVSEHLLLPSNNGEMKRRAGVDFPDDPVVELEGYLECFTMLAALAVAIPKVALGSMVASTGYRNPGLMAKMAVTIDDISGGRLVLGLGSGDSEGEHLTFGFPHEKRVGRFEEALQITRGLFNQESTDFDGAHHRLRGARLLPKGPRPGGPPILIGTLNPQSRMRRLVAQKYIRTERDRRGIRIFVLNPKKFRVSKVRHSIHAVSVEKPNGTTMAARHSKEAHPAGNGATCQNLLQNNLTKPLKNNNTTAAAKSAAVSLASIKELATAKTTPRMISQRELASHTKSFGAALRAALREDPDIIMVGEMRDLETISLAITAAETGHLVLGTLHTGNASRTLDRLLDVFPPDQQEQIRIMVSESLRGVISQQLIPRADGKGRVLALEILTNTPAVANVIREAKTFMLPGIIQTGKKQGMQLMDDALVDLASRGLITPEEALTRADQRSEMKARVNA